MKLLGCQGKPCGVRLVSRQNVKKYHFVLFVCLFALSCEVKRAYACTSRGTLAHDLHCFLSKKNENSNRTRAGKDFFLFFFLIFCNADDNQKALERFFVL